MTKAELVKMVGKIDYLDDASDEAQELYRAILVTGSIGLVRACLRMAYFAGRRSASQVAMSNAENMVENSGALMDLTVGMFDS